MRFYYSCIIILFMHLNIQNKEYLTKNIFYAIIFIVGWAITRILCEESPSTKEQSRLITSSQGNLRKSATEIYSLKGNGEIVR